MKHHGTSYRYARGHFAADIELTNKCNLRCTFCPRDRMPGTGFMSSETFYRIIDRILESPVTYQVASCGTGDGLLHPQIGDLIAYTRSKGLPFRLTTSGSLLTPERARILVDAGLDELHVSITGIHELYERQYGFPFEQTLTNIRYFRELASTRNRCDIRILIIQTRETVEQLEDIFRFWKQEGFSRHEIHLLEEHNRAGSLLIPTLSGQNCHEVIASDQQNQANPVQGCKCPAPYFTMFIGWDGQYYLCSNDWEKRAAFGSVHDTSFKDAFARKQTYMTHGHPLCLSCSHHPENYLADLQSELAHPPRQLPHTFISNTLHHQQLIRQVIDEMNTDATPSNASCC